MNKEDVQHLIEDSLKNMGCTDIVFLKTEEQMIAVIFNCKEVTSFVTEILGWKYSGIHLDPSNERQYRIDFTKIS